MSVQLSENEAKLIIESRRNPIVLLLTNYLMLVVVLVCYFAARDGVLSWDTFASIVVVFAVSLSLHVQFRIYPAYEKLHTILKQKVSESSEAIQAINAAKNGT